MSENLVECKNCKREIKKNIRRCHYCGILNPTVTVKEVITTILVVVSIMYAYTYFTK